MPDVADRDRVAKQTTAPKKPALFYSRIFSYIYLTANSSFMEPCKQCHVDMFYNGPVACKQELRTVGIRNKCVTLSCCPQMFEIDHFWV